jgi:hypothetical protein
LGDHIFTTPTVNNQIANASPTVASGVEDISAQPISSLEAFESSTLRLISNSQSTNSVHCKEREANNDNNGIRTWGSQHAVHSIQKDKINTSSGEAGQSTM